MARRGRDSFNLYRLDLPVAAIRALPPKTRRVFHLAGNIANEVNELHRLAIVLMHWRGKRLSPPLNNIAVGRAWVILRVLIGKTLEAFKFVNENISETSEFYEEYLKGPLSLPIENHPFLEPYNHTAYQRARDRINEKRGLLYALRNKITFHYDLGTHLDDGFNGLDSSWDQAWYAAGTMPTQHFPRHASFNSGAEVVIVRAMLQKAIETGKQYKGQPNPGLKKVMNDLADEVIESAGEVGDLMETLILCIMDKHKIGDQIKNKVVANLDHLPWIHKFRFPPFLKSKRMPES
jgi:hypothetical protein